MAGTDAPGASKLLVVDDEPTIVFAIKRYFRARGMQADGATDADGALALLARGGYAVAIVDLRLEGRGDTQGFEIVDATRARCPDAKIVMLTAYGSPRLEGEARRRGVHVVLRKPLPLPELADVVARLLDEQPPG